MTPLTQLAHQRLREVIKEGDFAIDATAGNGHDTVFLAQMVGIGGRVIAFDIQTKALEQTRIQLGQLAERVDLVHADHAAMEEYLPSSWRGKVAAVVMNLGYLPGGDHAITTKVLSTIRACKTAISYLQVEGLLSMIAYRGHPGGNEEATELLRWLENEQMKGSGTLFILEGNPANQFSPVLYWFTKQQL
ncbi:MAG: class I SAM-dependent methyltransferase [Zavarzinella sp.]